MFRKTHAFGLAAAVVLAAGVFAQVPAASAKALETGYQASAYGTEVNVDSAVQSGRSALSVLGCVSQPGVQKTSTAVSVNAPPALTTGTLDTSAASQTTATGVASAASSNVQSVSLLSGLVSATAVTSVSTTSRSNSTGALSVSAAGTQFAGLSVAGVPIGSTPAPNTKITLPGVGYVVLNQQTSSIGSVSANMTVIGIHVVVTITTPVAAAGTQVYVGYATSSLSLPVRGLLGGVGYGASAHVGGNVIAGEEFPRPMPCLGTHGNTLTNSAASVTIPGVLATGTVTDTANGTTNGKKVSGEVTAAIQNLNLAGGMVTATVVKADVTASGNPPSLGDNSQFAGLSVAGQPGLGDNVPANTQVPLSGIGTLWLHRVVQTGSGIRVIMIQLDVTVPSNPLGLSPGTVVNVASAELNVS
jgi:hypothetical protein